MMALLQGGTPFCQTCSPLKGLAGHIRSHCSHHSQKPPCLCSDSSVQTGIRTPASSVPWQSQLSTSQARMKEVWGGCCPGQAPGRRHEGQPPASQQDHINKKHLKMETVPPYLERAALNGSVPFSGFGSLCLKGAWKQSYPIRRVTQLSTSHKGRG